MVLKTIKYRTSKVTILTDRENKQKISKQKIQTMGVKTEEGFFLVKHIFNTALSR